MSEFKYLCNPGLSDIGKLLSFSATSVSRYGKKFHIIVIGAGGTGGYVLRDLGRYIYSLGVRENDWNIRLSIVDGDTVEEKNLLRQNFAAHDLGRNKAEVNALRLSRLYGIEVEAYTEMADEKLIRNLYNKYSCPTIIVSCVDNNQARRDIDRYVKSLPRHNLFWIDSGNTKQSGQVIMGDGIGIPTVCDVFPEILDAEKDPVDTRSCVDRLMDDEQNIFINIIAATHVLNFIRVITMNETTNIFGTTFNIFGKSDLYCMLNDEEN